MSPLITVALLYILFVVAFFSESLLNLDNAATYGLYLTSKPVSLPDGLGDISKTLALDNIVHEYRKGTALPSINPVLKELTHDGVETEKGIYESRILKEFTHEGVETVKGIYESPFAELLPKYARNAKFYMVKPSTAAKCSGVVILPGVLAETGFRSRMKRWSVPLAKLGYVTLLPMGPYLNDRRPPEQVKGNVRSLEHLFNQVTASTIEVACLTNWVHLDEKGHFGEVPIILAGTSFGASVTTGASFLLRHIDRIGVVNFAGPDSTRPFIHSIARLSIVPDTLSVFMDDELRIAKEMEQRGLLALQQMIHQEALPTHTEQQASGTAHIRNPNPKPCIILRATNDRYVESDSSDRVEAALVSENGNEHVKIWKLPIGHTIASFGDQGVFLEAIDKVKDCIKGGGKFRDFQDVNSRVGFAMRAVTVEQANIDAVAVASMDYRSRNSPARFYKKLATTVFVAIVAVVAVVVMRFWSPL